MSTPSANTLDTSHVLRDDRFEGQGGSNHEDRQKLHTKGWQVVSIPDNIETAGGKTFVRLTDNRHSTAIINLYPPGKRDEMHCHPGFEHLFYVVQGELHIYGINEGEDIVLHPGELVHINASYYYQLANESDELTVLYQVETKPAKPPKLTRYSYRGKDSLDAETLENG